MNMINAMFNTETAVRNILKASEQTQLSRVSHGDTINDFLEILNPEELMDVRKYMIKKLLK